MLRTTGIDELPQLWNIVCGEMRFIKPRPLTPQGYAALPESRSLRCRSQPGLTGLAQVNGGQALDPALKLALDLYLIDRRSLSLTVFVRAPNRPLLKEAQTILRVRSQRPFAAGYGVVGSFEAARNGADKAVASGRRRLGSQESVS